MEIKVNDMFVQNKCKDLCRYIKSFSGLYQFFAPLLCLQKKEKQKMKCVLCGKEIVGRTHNAEPLRAGRCCKQCDELLAIPYRMMLGGSHLAGEAVRIIEDMKANSTAVIDWNTCEVISNSL